MPSLGKTINRLREARSIARAELCKAAAISLPYLSLIERGERSPSLATLKRIAAALGVPFGVLASSAEPDLFGNLAGDRQVRGVLEALAQLEAAEAALRKRLGRHTRAKDGP